MAVKLLLLGQYASEEFIHRFRIEASAAASLQHPNIVAIHEVGVHQGQHYLVMDFVDGPNLAQLVRDQPLTAQRAAGYVKTIAQAIHFAHTRRILHRDLKPSNVLIDANDQPRVTDFGLAKKLSDDSDLTLTGQVLGSPSFLPPEQALGERGKMGPASDVYSLGAILYHALTGRPPFVAETLTQTLRMVAENEVVSPRLLNAGVPRDLDTICLTCLEKDPGRRYASAQALADELDRFLRGEPIQARPANQVEKVWRWCRRHPAIAGLTGLVALLLVTVAVVSTVFATRLQQANERGREDLRKSLLAQAHANRWSGRPGRRFDSLDAIRQAATIRPGVDLRNEAIAAMALVDVRPDRHWAVDHHHHGYLVFDQSFERYVRTHTNGTITLHRTSDDQQLGNWPAPGFVPTQVEFGANGRFLAAAWQSNNVYAMNVYDLSQNTSVPIELSNRWLRSFRFSPDGRRVGVVLWTDEHKPTITVYDTARWRPLASFSTQTLPFSMAFDPSGDRLAVTSADSSDAEIRDARSGELIQSLAHSSGVRGVAWSSTGDLIASSCNDRHIYLWDLTQSPPRPTLVPSEAVVVWLSFNGRGDLLISSDWNNWGKIWDVNTGKEFLRWPASALSRVTDRWISCYPSWNRLELFELSSGEECRRLHFKGPSGGNSSIAYSPDGQMLVSSHDDGLRFWGLASRRESLFIPHGRTRAVRFTPDGRGFLTAPGSGLFWWPINARDNDGTNHISIGPAATVSDQPSGAGDPLHRLIMVANGTACLLDAQSVRVERHIGTAQGVYAAALSPDGHQCATWSLGSDVVEVWGADDGRHLASLPSAAPCLTFSPDGRWLVTGSTEEYSFWERSSWTRACSIPRGTTGGAHGQVSFNAGGRLVAMSIGRGEVELVDTTTFTTLATLEAPALDPVSGLAFSPDGAQLAVSTQGQEIQLWNLPLVRQELSVMKLDWAAPSLPPATPAPARVTIVSGSGPTNADKHKSTPPGVIGP